ncbi:MAG: hypothetical protein AAF433_14945 [Bacteroidota bacterium]
MPFTLKFPNYLLSLIPLASLFIFSCGPSVYEAPEATSRVAEHAIIAVLPAGVTIKGRPKDDPEILAQLADVERTNFQYEIVGWMFRRKQQGRMFVDILDVQTTNARLTEAGFFDEGSETYTPAEWAAILNVDAVVTSNFQLSKPMSDGANLAVGLLTGFWGASNRTDVGMNIIDAQSGSLLWHYDWLSENTAFGSHEELVNRLMRNASRRMPYIVRR